MIGASTRHTPVLSALYLFYAEERAWRNGGVSERAHEPRTVR